MVEKIFVEKINDVYLRVTSESGVEHELSEYFSYFKDGYKFMQKYKTGAWDGKLRLYNLGYKRLYVGLYSHLVKFAENNNYEIVERCPINTHNNLDETQVRNWVNALEPTLDGNRIETWEHQHRGIYAALNEKRITLESPTSSGKSFIIYSNIRWHLEHGRSILLIVPTTQLCNQMYSDFEDYSSLSDWNVGDNCQKLYAGQSKQITKRVLISTWQSLHADKKQKGVKQEFAFDVAKFDCVIVDEVHTAAAESLTSLLESMTNIEYRLGVTGTLSDSKADRLQVCGLFGRQFVVTTTRELMDLGIVVKLDIRCLVINHCDEDRKLVKKAEYQDELDFVTQLEKRNKFIANLAIGTSGNTLILVTWIDKHLVKLEELIRAKAGDRKVFVIHGGIKPDKREAIRLQLANEDNAITIASSSTCATGINIPSIENIILGLAGKSKIRNLQSIGRGLRLKRGKTSCKLFDVVDDMSVKKYENHLLRHAKERFNIYAREQFDFKLINVKI